MKKTEKDKKSCVPLDGHRLEQLARLIIGQTRRNVRYGADRKERIAAPNGAVILSEHSPAPDCTGEPYGGDIRRTAMASM